MTKAATTIAYGGIAAGFCNDSSFQQYILGGDIAKAEETRNGDIRVTVVTATNGKVGGVLLLGNKVDFLPVESLAVYNGVDDPTKEFVVGKVFSHSTTEWSKVDGYWSQRMLPSQRPRIKPTTGACTTPS